MMHKQLLTLAMAVAFGVGTQAAHSQGIFGMISNIGDSLSKAAPPKPQPVDSGSETDSREVVQQADNLAQQQEEWMRPFVAAAYREGEWNSVLNLTRLGLAAMEKNRPGLARKSFDEAISRVEAIYADDANAAKARSVFNAESVKDWKGEPYERSMLYYYRGLLYVQEGDYQNARASFLAADRHDALSSAEDKTFTGSFGLMKYLAGWASNCDGDTTRASQLLGEARGIDAKINALPDSYGNSVALVESGTAPQKWGDGPHQELLKFRPGTDESSVSLLTMDSKPVAPLYLAGDLGYQATTRGGREIDGVMAGKARFKDNAGMVGDIATTAGIQVAMQGAVGGDRGMANLGLLGMFGGLVAKQIQASTTPAADLRAWDSLPSKVMLVSGSDYGKSPMQIMADGRTIPVTMQTTNAQCSMTWGRTRSALSTDMGGTVRFVDTKPVETNRGERNRAFRAMLANELVATNVAVK